MLKTSDMKFISKLRQNSRESLTNISRKTKIPISTLYDRLKEHEKSLILKHATLLDFSKLGYNCRANILLRTNKECRDKLMTFLKGHPAVNNLYKINNGFDCMAEAVFCNVKELENFIESLDLDFNIEDKRTHYIIDDLKREAFLSD